MGMFDNVICKVPLPVKVRCKPALWWKTAEFQTKDLDNALFDYEIRKSGLWRRHVEYDVVETEEYKKDKKAGGFLDLGWYMEEKNSKWKKENYTGTVNFYNIIFDVDGSNDLDVEFQALFKDGNLDGKIKLVEWELTDNAERKESSKKRKEKMKARQEYEKKWRYKYFGKYWNNFVFFVFTRLRKVGGWLSDSWKLESKFKF